MRSHHYQFSLRELFVALAPTGLCVVLLALALDSARWLGWLPRPAPNWDPDRTVLTHQARACHNQRPAQLIVTGDSTCLVGVDALQLSEALAPQSERAGDHVPAGGAARWSTLNLALYIWLDFRVYGELVFEFAARHPGEVRAVVLLVSPAKLIAEETSDQAHQEFWNSVRGEAWRREMRAPPGNKRPGGEELRDWVGAQTFREHFLTHVLATPLRGSAAAHFGFSSEIDAYMTRHRGSVLTFGTSVLPRRRPAGAAPDSAWSLPPAMAADVRAFRGSLPAGVKLFIGLTPGMAGAASANERLRRLALLQQWNAAAQADAVLTNLPPVLPDVLFSSGGHLNATGQRVFTRLLARELAPWVR